MCIGVSFYCWGAFNQQEVLTRKFYSAINAEFRRMELRVMGYRDIERFDETGLKQYLVSNHLSLTDH